MRRKSFAVLALFAALLMFSGMQVYAQDTARSDVPTPPKGAPAPPGPTSSRVPSNDNCANAIALTEADCPFTATVDTTGSTNEPGEPSPCGAIGNAIWYTFSNTTANIAAVNIETCSSLYDTAVAAYEVTGGACDFATFNNVACNDDSCGLQSQLGFLANPGTSYQLQFGGFANSTGNLTFTLDCAVFNCPPTVINGTLGSGDPNFPGPQASGTQNARLFRDGISSTCAAPKACSIFGAGTFNYDSYSIPNDSGVAACVTAVLEVIPQAGCNLQSNAYLTSFDPNNICTNYLADAGLSSGIPPTPTTMSFVVPAGDTLVMDVHSVNAGELGCTYTLTLLGDLCLIPVDLFDFEAAPSAGK